MLNTKCSAIIQSWPTKFTDLTEQPAYVGVQLPAMPGSFEYQTFKGADINKVMVQSLDLFSCPAYV